MAQRGTTAEIDLAELEKLAAMQATDEEVAAWFGVTTRTIERRPQDPPFLEIMERGKAKGKLNMRRAQLRLLEKGTPTMAIWLGKQCLGQTDEIRHDIHGNLGLNLVVVMPRELDPQNASGSLGVARQ